MDLKETDILGDDIGNHWYYGAKAAAMTRMLRGNVPQAILDVGAGSGFFSRHLLAHTPATEAWCVDTSYGADSDGQAAGKPVHYRRAIGTVDANLVLLMDVLEHVDDDRGLLREYAAKVPRGSRFLVTVPAFNFLWSGHDDFLEHRRRYTLPQLEAAVRDAGLLVRQGNYYFGLVFPIAATLRLANKLKPGDEPAHSQLKRHHPAVNTMLRTLCTAELPLMEHNRVAGLSVFCLAESA